MESNNINLLPHNEEGFIDLKKCLVNNQFVGLNRATGTGKSFIILKYLYENRNKRILFLSPSYPINNQLINEHTKELGIDVKDFSRLDTLIYSNLLKLDMEELANNYDIIILDEYHRCGAKKWGAKVNELLEYIKKNHPETKVIGTTATEIRYLDNEKNMNNILFDGVQVATLTLADAMLKEILPVPIYINSLVELSLEYETAMDKVYKKTLYDRERNYYLQLIEGIRNQIDEIVNKEDDISQYIKKDGKHLVFSSTINNIEKDKVIIDKLLDCNHNEYVVHSKKTNEANESALRNFRYDTEPSTLYCINILNEGVHVKGIDSIFMLRPTTSPIIFFQQLGRLLSYSRRKDNVVVFDLVNNIRKSPHIYQLYMDLCKRAKELIKIDPENKERYLNIIKKFKIVDSTSKIYNKLDILNKVLTNENFYKKKIDFIIEILQENNHVNELEEKLAKIDLFKYYKYITLEQFRLIKNLDINKPSIFNLTEEEFIDMLNGEENIYKKEKKLAILIVNKINTFYENNGYFPSILADNTEEYAIARDLINIYDEEKINKSIFENKNLDNLTEYEKIIYGITKDINFNLLYIEINKLIENNLDISSSVLSLIQRQNTEISKKYFNIVLEYNATRTKNKIKNDEFFLKQNSSEEVLNLKILYEEEYKKIAKECILEMKKYDSTNEYMKKISEEIIAYINKTKRMPVYYIPDVEKEELKQTRILYLKKMIFYSELRSLGYINLFDEVYNSTQLELTKLNKTRVLEKLIEFLKQHNGDMPSLNIKTDKQLALEISRIKPFLDDKDIDLINSYKSDDRTKEVITKYISFVKEHKRYPLTTSDNEEEKALLDDYNRNKSYFSENEKKTIKLELTKLNKTRILEKLIEFLKQHNGDMPSLNIKTDRQLALEVSRIKSILDDNDIDLINSYKSDDRIREVVIKYISFVKKHKRYPLTTSDNEEEKKLLSDYIRNEPYFSENEKKMINNLKKVVNSRVAMQNAYAELLKKKRGR